jgi:DNA-binding protein H-NS
MIKREKNMAILGFGKSEKEKKKREIQQVKSDLERIAGYDLEVFSKYKKTLKDGKTFKDAKDEDSNYANFMRANRDVSADYSAETLEEFLPKFEKIIAEKRAEVKKEAIYKANDFLEKLKERENIAFVGTEKGYWDGRITQGENPERINSKDIDPIDLLNR